MPRLSLRTAQVRSLLFGTSLAVALASASCTPADPPARGDGAPQHEHRAVGTFEVVLVPRETLEHPGGAELGRTSLEKRFAGDLVGTASGTMLTALTPVEGSAGYVAIERVEGSLQGRAGTFLLQHHGLMDRGAQSLAIEVIPDSGTGELEGLRGTMTLSFENGGRGYELRYSLTDAR